jgi:aldose 1-epimerase
MRQWQVVALDADEERGASVTAELRFEASEAPGVYYPHAVLLRMSWRLIGNRISGALEVYNEGNEEAPFGFGLHPYFMIRGKPEEVEVKAPTRWQYDADADGVNRRIPVRTALSEQLSEGLTLDRLPGDVDHFVFRMEEGQANRQLKLAVGDVSIGFEFDSGFPYLVVFKPKWADALSLEPWSCISDACNSPLSPEWTGAAGIKAGERRSMEWAWQADKSL